MDKHIQVLGVLYIVFAIMGFLGAGIVFVVFGLGGAITQDDEAGLLVAGMGGFIAMIILISSIPSLFTGIGLLKRRNWGRILGLVMSFFNLLSLPFGTALGIYGIWVLFKDETIRIFSGQPPVAQP